MEHIIARSLAFLLRIARSSLVIFICWPCCAWATQTIVGTVLNGTTGKPSAGDEIALLTVTKGSLEVSRGKTAGDGSFRLATDAVGPHVLRVRHNGVIYQKKLTTDEVAPSLQVFDSTTVLAGISESVTVMKIEPAARWLNVTELHSIVNESKPPLTLLASEGNLKIFLPNAAVLDAVVVQEPSFRPDKVKPHPVGPGSRQFLVGYPLRPGTTEFAVKYHLPYSEKATINPRLQYPSQLWTVMFPKSMNFTPLHKSSFHSFMEQDGMRVEAIAKVSAGEVPGFVISGSAPVSPAQVSSDAIPPDLLPMLSSHAMNRPVEFVRPRASAPRSNRLLLYMIILGIALIVAYSLLNRTRQIWLKAKSS